jgi:hypothetical protein
MPLEPPGRHAVDDDGDISVRLKRPSPFVHVPQVAETGVQQQHRRKRTLSFGYQHEVVPIEARRQLVDRHRW